MLSTMNNVIVAPCVVATRHVNELAIGADFGKHRRAHFLIQVLQTFSNGIKASRNLLKTIAMLVQGAVCRTDIKRPFALPPPHASPSSVRTVVRVDDEQVQHGLVHVPGLAVRGAIGGQNVAGMDSYMFLGAGRWGW